jgi:hypothetical protein
MVPPLSTVPEQMMLPPSMVTVAPGFTVKFVQSMFPNRVSSAVTVMSPETGAAGPMARTGAI